MADPAFFHLIMFCASCHMRYQTQTFDAPEITYHKLKTLELVNEQISDPKVRCSDCVLETVSSLAIQDVSQLGPCGFPQFWLMVASGLWNRRKLKIVG